MRIAFFKVMRMLALLYLFSFISVCACAIYYPPTPLSPSPSPIYETKILIETENNISLKDLPKILILTSGLALLFSNIFMHLSIHVNFVTFNTNLTLYRKKSNLFFPVSCVLTYLSFFILGLLLCDFERDKILLLFLNVHPSLFFGPKCSIKFIRFLTKSISYTFPLYIFSISVTPIAFILCLVIIQIWCYIHAKCVYNWLPIFLILISNDVELNPGDYYEENFFTFMSWNLNSLAKKDFERVDLIEAHNNAFNYDLISLGETSLNSSVEIREELLKDYTFVSANHPSDHRRGGVGLFYKNSLPIKIRNDLSFSECIVVELKFGKKKIFFSVLYRSPANNSKSPEFQMFLANFEKLHLMIKAENPFALFFAGDFNAHSESWWPEGDSNEEGTILDDLFIKLGLSQLISDPTNIEPLKNASCIDLILTDQPNIVLDSGTRASLDSCCHHQITHCKVNFRIPPPLPFERRIWYYNRADVDAIKRSMNFFPWHEHLNINADPNWQVKNFTRIFLNIMSNFIPNEKKRCVPRDPPWITKHLKSMLNRKNRLYKNYKKHGYKDDDKIRLDLFRIECQEGIKAAKSLYLSNLGKKANDPYTSQKSYWKIINRVMNKCRAPKIPPILVTPRLFWPVL